MNIFIIVSADPAISACIQSSNPRKGSRKVYHVMCNYIYFLTSTCVISFFLLSFRESVGGLYYLSYLDNNLLLGRAVGGGGVFVFTRAQPLWWRAMFKFALPASSKPLFCGNGRVESKELLRNCRYVGLMLLLPPQSINVLPAAEFLNRCLKFNTFDNILEASFFGFIYVAVGYEICIFRLLHWWPRAYSNRKCNRVKLEKICSP